MPTPEQPRQTTDLQRLLAAEPDLVDRIFDYVASLLPELGARGQRIAEAKDAVRAEFAGCDAYIARRRGRGARPDPEVVQEILTLFNGRNASEVARRLGVSRATVYRVLKQPGSKSSQLSGT